MKRVLVVLGISLLAWVQVAAQKYALIDMEYILKNIPSYEMANEQLQQISRRWQAEVETKMSEVENMYKTYQSEVVFLTPEMKAKREEDVLNKEKEAQDLRIVYFGPEGELFKKRQALIMPIQDDIYNAVKAISEAQGYMMVMDRASSENIIYASPKIDISNDVLSRLGYSK